MKFKEAVLERINRLNENIDVVKGNMDRHAMSPEQVYEAIGKIQYELTQIETLIKRE
jgi:predicted phosphodiesterase